MHNMHQKNVVDKPGDGEGSGNGRQSSGGCRHSKNIYLLPLHSNLPHHLPDLCLTQGRLVKEAGDMHLYSGIFSVMEEDKKVKTESKKENDEKRNGEILALLPHFLSFTSLTEAGSLTISI